MDGLKLQNDSRIAIIGGGPAGAFFAHFIIKYFSAGGINPSVTIFDGKDFLMPGPKGCNLCAGVLSYSLHQKLMDEGIFLPESRIINKVEGYVLHVRNERIEFSCVDNNNMPIATVFRGNGPRCSTFPDIVSFDDYLLNWVQDKGAGVISKPVRDIKLFTNCKKPIRLSFGDANHSEESEADLVVGAFGINSSLSKKIQEYRFGYKPPTTLVTYQAEFRLGRANIQGSFGNSIHVFIPKSKIIRYAMIIPKGDYISLTVIGKKDATKDILSDLTDLKEIRNKVPFANPACFCFPRIAVSPAKNPYTDRFVIVGDASYSRHYKNGIESAFVTAQLAAKTAINGGIDSNSFSTSYYSEAKRKIIYDNYYGRFLLKINDIITGSPVLTKAQLSLAKDKARRDASRKMRSILWNMFTGNIPYREIFKTSINFKMQMSLLLNAIRLIFKRKPKPDNRDSDNLINSGKSC